MECLHVFKAGTHEAERQEDGHKFQVSPELQRSGFYSFEDE